MKKCFFTIASMLLPLLAIAGNVEIDGIYYNLLAKNNMAEVVKNPNGNYSDSIFIPEKVVYEEKEYQVTSIGENAFFCCNMLLAVELPNSINSIGRSAFWGCHSLDSIAIPEQVTVIQDNVFADCENLRRVVLPDNITSIGGSAFNSCLRLDSLDLPSTVESIGDWAFTLCDSLSYIDIPQSLKRVGRGAFAGCPSLMSVRISDLSSWCMIDFGDRNANPLCTTHKLIINDEEITDLVVPDGVTKIGQAAFADCKNLSSVVIPNTVTSIGSNAFCYCSNLASATIPNSVTSIGNYAFVGCVALTSATIPSNVTTIGERAFQYCSGLTSITIPNTVKRIVSETFMGCSNLSSITIGSGVTYIGPQAFALCSELSEVYCLSKNVPLTEPDAFRDSYISYATLYVPESSIDNYKSSNPWSTFNSIIAVPDYFYTQLSCEDIVCAKGTNPTLNIVLQNKGEVKSCQFDLRLPAGVLVALTSHEGLDVKLTTRAEGHSASCTLLENGDYHFVISSPDNDSFTGNGGVLMVITLEVSATMEAGEYIVQLMNAEISLPDGNDMKVIKPANTESKLAVKAHTLGDVNNDGTVSVTDVGCAINYILNQIPIVFVFEAADMNGDKSISVTDVGLIINIILNEGATSRSEGPSQEAQYGLPTLTNNADGYLLALDGQQAFTAFQMDMALPVGTETCEVRLSDKVADSHLLTCRKLSNGHYRLVCYSPTNEPLPADATELLGIATNSNIILSGIRFTTVGLSEVSFDDMSATTTGIADAFCYVPQPAEFKVYSLDGRLCRIIRVQPGENPLMGLKAGIYMIDNRKVVVR